MPVGVAEWQRKFHTKQYAIKFALFAASSHFCLLFPPPWLRRVCISAQSVCKEMFVVVVRSRAGGANVVFPSPAGTMRSKYVELQLVQNV